MTKPQKHNEPYYVNLMLSIYAVIIQNDFNYNIDSLALQNYAINTNASRFPHLKCASEVGVYRSYRVK